MAEDRRSAPRASLPGVRVTYESAGGDPHQADVANLGTGGLFVRSDAPLPVGKRVSLDLLVTGEPATWAALGRIVWTRPNDEGPGRPPGMGVKLIDVDDAVVGAIERLVAAREPTEPGVGEGRATPTIEVPPTVQAPPRERTMLGVGQPIVPAAEPVGMRHVAVVEPAPPPLEAPPRGAPAPEFSPEPTPEASLAIELVSKKADSGRTPPREDAALDDSVRLPKKKGGARVAWLLLAIVLATASGLAYANRSRLPALGHRVRSALGR
jgi:uncharacterized protein (TIGR02266 family)